MASSTDAIPLVESELCERRIIKNESTARPTKQFTRLCQFGRHGSEVAEPVGTRSRCRSFGPNVGKYPSQPANLFGIAGVCELAVQAILLPRRTSRDRYTVQQFPWHCVFPQLSSAVVYPLSPLHPYINSPLPERPAPGASS